MSESYFDRLTKIVIELHKKNSKKNVYQDKVNIRQQLYDLLKENLKENLDLFIVGSTQSEFSLARSDLDLCLVFYDEDGKVDEKYVYDHEATVDKLNNIGLIVANSEIGYNISIFSRAIVPIFRFIHKSSRLAVDLNINRIVTIHNTCLLSCYKILDDRVAPLVVAVKCWARKQGINNAYRGTLSSYSLTLMVIHFLQSGCCPPVLPYLHTIFKKEFFTQIHHYNMKYVLKHVHKMVSASFVCENKSSLGELLAEFITYYTDSTIFNRVISIRHKSVHFHCPHRSSYIMIEDPFECKNTAYSVYTYERFMTIINAFRDGSTEIMNGTFGRRHLQ